MEADPKLGPKTKSRLSSAHRIPEKDLECEEASEGLKQLGKALTGKNRKEKFKWAKISGPCTSRRYFFFIL